MGISKIFYYRNCCSVKNIIGSYLKGISYTTLYKKNFLLVVNPCT